MYSTEFLKKFLSLVPRLSSDVCWPFCGPVDNRGYGRLQYNKRKYRSHRIMWEIKFGDIPKGLCICHKCDNPPCINPDHLFLGTQNDNYADKLSKNRQSRLKGSKNPNSKINESIATEILKMGTSFKISEISNKLKLPKQLIYRVITKKFWKHVNI